MSLNPLKFVATADWQPEIRHHSRLNPATKLYIAQESNLQAIQHIAEQTIESGASVMHVAGDVVDSGDAPYEFVMRLYQILAPVAQQGIAIQFDEGNHERIKVKPGHRTPLDALAAMLRQHGTVISSNTTSLYDMGAYDLISIPYPQRTDILRSLDKLHVDQVTGDGIVVRETLNAVDRLLNERADQNKPFILTGHFSVDKLGLPGSEQDVENLMNDVVFPLEKLEQFGAHANIFGHIHKYQWMTTRSCYVSSPNLFTFTDVGDEKGASVFTLTDNGFEHERIATPTRRMFVVDLEKEDFNLELQPDDAVQIKLPEGETEIHDDIKEMARSVGAFLVKKVRPVVKEKPERLVLPERISTIDALTKHLSEQGYEPELIDILAAKAQALEVNSL